MSVIIVALAARSVHVLWKLTAFTVSVSIVPTAAISTVCILWKRAAQSITESIWVQALALKVIVYFPLSQRHLSFNQGSMSLANFLKELLMSVDDVNSVLQVLMAFPFNLFFGAVLRVLEELAAG